MAPTVEFSHKVTVNPWPEDGIQVELTATASERDALRSRFDLVDVQSLNATIGIEQGVMELVLTGRIEAVVAQNCVVTLKPVTSSMEVPFERHYRRREIHEKMVASGETLASEADDIDIDVLEGDEIDVGEAVAEELYLALDPYPRCADADQALEAIKSSAANEPDSGAGSPFEKLRRH